MIYFCFFVGVGMVFLFCFIVVIVGIYFDEKKGFVSGLLMLSGSLGVLVMVLFLWVLLNLYLVEGVFLIIVVVVSYIIVCGLLFCFILFYIGKRNKVSYEFDCLFIEE